MTRIAIIGAGPCGLGAAYALNELGHDDWTLYEAEGHAGGLASSFVDNRGFTWDIGGHVLFTRIPLFQKIVHDVLAGDHVEHERSAWVKMQNAWVPYPFQNNLHLLPEAERKECEVGLATRPKITPTNFAEWIESTQGAGIARVFMKPYNTKVWGTDPEKMDSHWIGERVSVVDSKKTDPGPGDKVDSKWGPNSTFIFPSHGGTGEIYRRLARPLASRIRYGSRVSGLDVEKREIHFTDGSSATYDHLISSARLDQMVGWIPSMSDHAAPLRPVGGAIVGIGVEEPESSGRCWVYFPTTPPCFYRVTYFHHYAAANVPNADTSRYASYMCETVFRPGVDATNETIVQRTIDGLLHAGVITRETMRRIVSTYVIPVPAIYPVPVLGLKEALPRVHARLEKMNILSRGRFGGWRYEVGNMDHSFMQGYEAVRRVLLGEEETVWKR